MHENWLELFDELILGQQKKVLRVAQQFYPGVTPEDIRNPQDFEKLQSSANFNFEDGILAGYISAKMAFLAEARSPRTKKSSQAG